MSSTACLRSLVRWQMSSIFFSSGFLISSPLFSSYLDEKILIHINWVDPLLTFSILEYLIIHSRKPNQLIFISLQVSICSSWEDADKIDEKVLKKLNRILEEAFLRYEYTCDEILTIKGLVSSKLYTRLLKKLLS